jgi:hypothetical protein
VGLKSDSIRLDWLGEREGLALMSDDAGHWAVSDGGFQNVPQDAPCDVSTTFFIEKDRWKPSIREAIDDAIRRENEEMAGPRGPFATECDASALEPNDA